MTTDALFSCADFALLRAPVHSERRAWETRAQTTDDADGERAELLARIRRLAADPLVRETVMISSPSLAHRLDHVLDESSGTHPPDPAALQRAARALARYRLRMATRCTPFGLMAGVAPVEFADDPTEVKVRLGTAHRRAVRPDREWLMALVTGWEQRPAVLRQLRVTRNDLCQVRGDRLVLPYLPDTGAGGSSDRAVHEVSVRLSAAVRTVGEATRAPIPARDVLERLTAAFPTASPAAALGMLVQLVGKEILLTDLRPPLEETDPLGYVRDRLSALEDIAEVLPEAERLRELPRLLADYAAQPLGAGRRAWRQVSDRMRRLHPGDQLVQVDLALDADVRIPRLVAEEAERAAGLLWRLAPPAEEQSPLREYHGLFLERYGSDRLVPVKELLDPGVGLGAPAGYQRPPSHRRPPSGHPRDGARDEVLARLAQRATLTGQREIVLTDDADDPVLSVLAHDGGTPLPSLEMYAQVLAESTIALHEGRFQLVVINAAPQAGAMCGRFTALLPENAQRALRDLAQRSGGHQPEALRAQLTFQAPHSRSGNVAQVPRWLDHLLPVAAFADRDDPHTLDVNDLLVGADPHRLFLVDGKSGREVVPAVFHMLTPQWNAPNIARFLREVSATGVRGWRVWNWGTAGTLPYLPRVRYGRSVLAPAQWRPPAEVRDQDAPFDVWSATVRAWRERWRVPERVCASHADHRLEVDLTDEEHLRLLRHELGRRPQVMLDEATGSGPGESGWLSGADGPYRNEVVFPLIARQPARPGPDDTRQADRRSTRRRSAPAEHWPGGEWLYASVYGPSAQQTEILATRVPPLVDALPEGVDRWFFLRYQDQDDHHLRFRFHGTPRVLYGELLPRLHDWTAELRRQGLVRRLTLDTYDPEWERYGGPEAMTAAERAFHADSVAVVEQLRLLHSGQLDIEPLLLAAANYVDLARTFWPPGCSVPTAVSGAGPDADLGVEPAWLAWLLTRLKKGAEHGQFQSRRRDAVQLIDPYGDWAVLRAAPAGTAVLQAWHQRAAALADYGQVLQDLGSRAWGSPPTVLPSLFHMHHNRLTGARQDQERASYAVARGAVQAHRDRRRWAR